jgi:hypothetical protein
MIDNKLSARPLVAALSLAVGVALPPLAAADPPLAPTVIVAAPSTYEGKTVTVAGTVARFQTSSSPRGPVAFFQLCDASCIVVLDFTKPAYKDGENRTVTGTFRAHFKAPRRTFDNVVLVQ